jgi:hypothetical protein
MTRKFIVLAAAAGLLLPAASRAQDILKPVAASAILPWKINCHGLSNVPMTADAMQVLPLRVVATLSCEDQVAVLSDTEGYTLNVRTAEGKTGYVAAMYVAKTPPAKPAPRVEPASAAVRNGVARWKRGERGCGQFMKDGALVESLTANGVTVQVSLREAGSKLRADVAIGNFSELHVYINPVGIALETAGAHSKSLAYRDPAQLARETAQQGAASGGTMNAGYKVADYSPVFAPVYAVQRQPATEDAPRPQAKPAANVADPFSAAALKKGTVRPDGKTWGAVWFERDPNPDQYVMRVPIDNQVFEFPLTLNQQR